MTKGNLDGQIDMFAVAPEEPEDSLSSIRKEYSELVKTMNYHCDRYYNDDEPEISDFEYDTMNLRLKEIEKEYPEIVVAQSPSFRVGWKAQKGVLVKHNVPMLSLQDVFSREEVDEFVNSLKAELGPDTEFLVETKIDGLSMALRYENGKLVKAITRGDGINSGEDVTQNAQVISDVVKQMPHPIEYIEIRGEVYMTRKAFENVNRQAEDDGKKLFANPRNCAAGTLRQLDTRVTKRRNLSLFIFNIQESRGRTFETHAEGYDFLRENGVKVIEKSYCCKSADEVWDAITNIGKSRGELEYDIDGAVVKLNSIEDRKKLGNTIKYPKWSIAYKYPPEEKETVITDIETGLGRTGRITPVAVFEPIALCGTTVRRATLHNQAFIDELDIGIGDTVVVYKSGEIIPKIKNVSKKSANHVRFVLPDKCPVCGSNLVREENQADLKCVNVNCPGKLVNRIANFVSRDCLDVKGFGEEYISKLIDAGYIDEITDIFDLRIKREQLLEDKIFGLAKNTDKLLDSIDNAVASAPAFKILAGLGIPNVGKATARELMRHFSSIDDVVNASIEDLMNVGDIGQISAEAIYSFFKSPANLAILDALRKAGATFTSASQIDSHIFDGKTFCITGTLPTLSREKASELIERNGGRVSTSVSSKTSFLLAGEAAGSKLNKANELGIMVISEQDLFEKLQNPNEGEII